MKQQINLLKNCKFQILDLYVGTFNYIRFEKLISRLIFNIVINIFYG
jgi:hypothetical protein